MQGIYIAIEGAVGVGKTTIARRIVEKLESLSIPAKAVHEPDANHDATTHEIRRLTQDSQYPMNSRTEALLFNAARSQSLQGIAQARAQGIVCIADRSYLSTLAVQFYGRNDISNYQQLNTIIEFAVNGRWPDLTIVLDAPVDSLRQRIKDRGEQERYDNLDAATLERIRAGYLWEAKQREMPVVYATGLIDEVFQEVWRHIAVALDIKQDTTSELTAVSDVLPKRPAATALKAKTASQQDVTPGKSNKEQISKIPAMPEPSYYIPSSLPDDVQCDYCDDMDQILAAHKELVTTLTQHLQKNSTQSANDPAAHAEELLRGILPVATVDREARSIIPMPDPASAFEATASELLPQFSTETASVRFVSHRPRNELDILSDILYEHTALSLAEVKNAVETWSYAKKSDVFATYVQSHPTGKALDGLQYEWEFLTPFTTIEDVAKTVAKTIRLQLLTPRYGYSTPKELEEAGLSDAYDEVFDMSLAAQSRLQAKGFAAEAQFATLLGHKQRWVTSVHGSHIQSLLDALPNNTREQLRAELSEVHPLFVLGLGTRLDNSANGN